MSFFRNYQAFSTIFPILLHEKCLRFDWPRVVVFQLNLKYLHVKITNLSWEVVYQIIAWTPLTVHSPLFSVRSSRSSAMRYFICVKGCHLG